MRSTTAAGIIVLGIVLATAAGCATCHGSKGGAGVDISKPPETDVSAKTPEAAPAKAVEAAPKPADPSLGYTPKTTPDTVLDYRPRLKERIETLPAPHVPSLPVLVKLLEQTKKEAEKNAGQWTEGRQMLGANAKEYVPSDDELVAAEIGDRVEKVVKHPGWTTAIRVVLNTAAIKVGAVTFKRFGFRHSDVMGSGRFFYVTGPEEVTVELSK